MTSQALGAASYYSGAGHQLKLTSYNTTSSGAAADAGGEALSDNDYYKSWRHNVTSYDDVSTLSPTAGVCYYDDEDRRRYVEHIYESPKFDKRHVS